MASLGSAEDEGEDDEPMTEGSSGGPGMTAPDEEVTEEERGEAPQKADVRGGEGKVEVPAWTACGVG